MTGRPDEAADRQALLELLLAEEGIDPNAESVASASSIAPRDPQRPAVLSYGQERMWFLHQVEDDVRSMNIRAAVRVHGAIDPDVLYRSVLALLQRHDALRTVILDDHGEPVPVVRDVVDAPLGVDDVRLHADPDAAVRQILAEEADRTFDLANDVPIFVRLVQAGEEASILSIVMHHVASDGHSVRVVFRDLAVTYQALASGSTPDLPDLPVDYLDYADWQRKWRSDDIDRQLDYWTNRLRDDLGNCELPADRARPPVHTVDGSQVSGDIDAELLETLRQIGQRHGATLFMTLLAAFDLVLDRRIGPEGHQVTVGTPVAGRVRPELEHMVGVFINTLVLRSDLEGDPTFGELVERVRDDALDAFGNQDIPFERLLAELKPPRDASRTPFFSVLFNMMTADSLDDGLADRLFGHDFEMLEQPDLEAKFDLTVYVRAGRQRSGGAPTRLMLVYNRNLFDQATIEELLAQYVGLLRQIASDPDRPISTYTLVTERARPHLPDLRVPLDTTWHGSVPEHLARHGRERPDDQAVVDGASSWTYGELASAAHRLARVLRDAGTDSGDIVVIWGHRCASLVWAVSGALAAGAAYTIIDPSYPSRRIADQLSKVAPRVFVRLAEAGDPPGTVIDRLDELGTDVRIDLPADGRTAFTEIASESLGVAIGPNDLACVTMTSGSTGDAQPVLGRHGSLTHFFPWQSEQFGVTGADRFSMLSGLAHDPIQRDMFWPILLGATIVVPDPDQIPSPGWIAQWMREQRVSVAHLTPAMGRLLLEAPRSSSDAEASIESLRLAMFIGEPLTSDVVDRLHERAPTADVVNLYGTTETQRASGYHVLARESGSHRSVVPLGRGLPGAQLLVRTVSGGEAGVAEIGEIWMRSHHLALGFLGAPEQSAARFVRTPGSEAETDRMYRTGDLGRYLLDGSVEFVGRIDDQVQVRGFRVELGEVRAALCGHGSVRDAVVVADDRIGETTIAAYVVSAPGCQLDAGELVAHLRERLPAHMVPTSLTPIDDVPLTPNGKLDRRRLPDPAVVALGDATAPRDALEHLLVELWQDVLARPSVGIHDNFFELGGYSLLATRLFAAIEDALGERIPVATLFRAPTVAELADTIRRVGSSTTWSSLVPISPGGSRPPLFYVGSYLISILQLAHLGDELGPEQPLYGLQPRGLDGSAPPAQRVEEMAAHYIAEMKSVQPHGPYLIAGHCSGSWPAFEIARQLEAAGDDVAGAIMIDLGPPGVERLEVSAWRYVWHRLKFFHADGRLWNAVRWQLEILVNRVLVRRVGTDTVRHTAEVHAAHRHAHSMYEGGDVTCDLVLLRSDETIAVGDRSWFLRWEDCTSGTLHVPDPVVGIHSDLLEQPNVKHLAARLNEAIDLLLAGRDVATAVAGGTARQAPAYPETTASSGPTPAERRRSS